MAEVGELMKALMMMLAKQGLQGQQQVQLPYPMPNMNSPSMGGINPQAGDLFEQLMQQSQMQGQVPGLPSGLGGPTGVGTPNFNPNAQPSVQTSPSGIGGLGGATTPGTGPITGPMPQKPPGIGEQLKNIPKNLGTSLLGTLQDPAKLLGIAGLIGAKDKRGTMDRMIQNQRLQQQQQQFEEQQKQITRRQEELERHNKQMEDVYSGRYQKNEQRLKLLMDRGAWDAADKLAKSMGMIQEGDTLRTAEFTIDQDNGVVLRVPNGQGVSYEEALDAQKQFNKNREEARLSLNNDTEKMSPENRYQFLQNLVGMGVDFSEGEVKKFLKTGKFDDNHWKRIEQANKERTQDLNERRQDFAEEKFNKEHSLAERKFAEEKTAGTKKEAPQAIKSKFIEANRTLANYKAIKEMIEKNPSFVGPFGPEGRQIGSIIAGSPIIGTLTKPILDRLGATASPEEQKFRSYVKWELASQIRALAGTAITPTEAKLLLEGIPNPDQTHDKFMANLQVQMEKLEYTIKENERMFNLDPEQYSANMEGAGNQTDISSMSDDELRAIAGQ